MKYIFILNPKAGSGGVEEKLRNEVAALPCADRCEIYLTKAPHDATDYVKRTIAENPEEKFRFIACGGDGTINEVFSGAVGAANASVSCYACGSGNDFVKVFGGQEKFTDAAKLVSAPERKIDALKVGERYSFNVTNFGFDTTVAITINKEREKSGTVVEFYLCKEYNTLGLMFQRSKNAVTVQNHTNIFWTVQFCKGDCAETSSK